MGEHKPKRWPLCSHAGGCTNYVERDPDLYCTQHTRTGEDQRRHDERRKLRFYNNAGNQRIKMLPRRQADRRQNDA